MTNWCIECAGCAAPGRAVRRMGRCSTPCRAAQHSLCKQHRFTLTFGALRAHGARTWSTRTVYVLPSQPVEIASERTAPTIGLGAFFFSLRYSAAEWRNSLRRLYKLILSLLPGRFANWIWSVYWVFYAMRFVLPTKGLSILLQSGSVRYKLGTFSHVWWEFLRCILQINSGPWIPCAAYECGIYFQSRLNSSVYEARLNESRTSERSERSVWLSMRFNHRIWW